MYIRIFSFMALLTVSLGSCKKFLEPIPNDFLNPENYYTTEQQLEFASAGVYHVLGQGGLWGSGANYLLGFAGDEGYMNRFTLTAGPWNYNFATSDQYATAFWRDLYNGINRANVVIENVDRNPEIEQSFRDRIRGEMLFLRGFYYFQLVQYYGGVPLKTEATRSVNNTDIARASVKEVYDQIIADMEAAEPLVDPISTIGFGGRISKSAVRGFLAKVNLFMAGEPLKETSRYAEAAKWAKMVIDDGQAGHSLNPSFPDIFIKLAADQYDIKESIWEIEFFGNRTDSYVETTNHGWINGPAATVNNLSGRADAYMWATSKLLDVFEAGDNRKFMSLAFFANTPAGPNGSKTYTAPPATDLLRWRVYPAKFRREYETLLPKSPTTTPQNIVMLRYADVLLMYAEALNEINGPTAEVINAVNQVRRRGWAKGVKNIEITSGGSGYTTAPSVTFSGAGSEQALGTATVSNGAVTAIVLNRDSVNFYRMGKYTSAPSITISGGGGTGAAATATIYVPTDADVPSENTTSKEVFRTFLQAERMRELSFEGSRKADLLRWGIFLEVMRDMGIRAQQEIPGNAVIPYFTNVQPRHLLLPIPNAETVINRAIQQNPGWE